MMMKGREIVSRSVAQCPEQQALCFLQASFLGQFAPEEIVGGFTEILPSFFASNPGRIAYRHGYNSYCAR